MMFSLGMSASSKTSSEVGGPHADFLVDRDPCDAFGVIEIDYEAGYATCARTGFGDGITRPTSEV